MTSILEEQPDILDVKEGKAGVEKEETDLTQEAFRVNEEMWQARYDFDEIRRSKTVDTITHADLEVRDRWRAKREELIVLLRALPDDVSSNVDLSPPSKIVEAAVVPTTGRAEDIDWVGETRIKPDDVGAHVPTGGSEAGESLELGSMAGRDHTNMTTEEIDYMIFNAKATGRKGIESSQGVTGLGLSYWEEQKRLKQQAEDEAQKRAQEEAKRLEAEAKAAEEAEANEKRAKELKDKISELVTHLSQNRYRLNDEILPGLKATNWINKIEKAGWEDKKLKTEDEIKNLVKEIKDLEKELDKLEKGVGKSFKDRFKEAYEKTKKLTFFDEEGSEEESRVSTAEAPKPAEIPKSSERVESPKVPRGETIQPEPQTEAQEKTKKKFSLWKWTKERVKTFFKDGGLFGEFVQAEKMRQGTGHASSSAEALSTLIKTEWNIDNPDAVQDIANEALKVEKKTGIRMDNQEFGGLLEQVSKDRKEANDDEKNYIIKDAIDNLKINLAKARGQATSETVLTSENLVQVDAEMKAELNKISDAALVKDFKGFAKVMRDNLDKYWWLRYLYGGAELAALGGLGYHYLSGNEAINLPNVAKPKLFMPETLKPPGVSDDVRLMMDHYWGVAKDLLREHGVLNPTDGQTMEVTKVLAGDNNVAVPPWGIEGESLHTKLPVHWVLVKGAASFILRNYIGTP
ncbi:MAG: hypothetical protein Q8Q89_02060 [bacterium]|nr:hypothetical protein [bacterium]